MQKQQHQKRSGTASVGRDSTRYSSCSHNCEECSSIYQCGHTAWLLSTKFPLIASNTPTFCSIQSLQKIPQQLTVSPKDCKAIHNTYNHAQLTSLATSTGNRYPCMFTSYFPSTTTSPFPHLLCTTNSRLVAATMVLGLEERLMSSCTLPGFWVCSPFLASNTSTIPLVSAWN